jgi:hypothetical protein
MEPFREIARLLVIFGVALAAVGLLLMLGARLSFRLGRLPGDIVWQGKNTTFYFPIVTCIVVSVALTLLMWLVQFWRK